MNIEQRGVWWQAAGPLTAATAACKTSPAAAARRTCLTLLLAAAAAAVILFARPPGPLVFPCAERSLGPVIGAPPPPPSPPVELVVAHYDEDLGSLVPHMLPSLGSGAVVTVYSKGKHRPPGGCCARPALASPPWPAAPRQPRTTAPPPLYSFPAAGATRLPNVGREAHTYLHHLTERYHSLADVTLFVMGSAALSGCAAAGCPCKPAIRVALLSLCNGWLPSQ